MGISFKRMRAWGAVALVAAGGLVGLGQAAGASVHRAKKVYNIYYDTSYVGEGWRTQAIDTAQAVLRHAPLKGHATLHVIVSAQNTASSQIASLNDIILKHPDAIVLEPSSPPALEPVVQQACNDRIVVTVFDAPVPNACTYFSVVNFKTVGQEQGAWMAATLHGKGDILVDRGLPGTSVSADILGGVESVLKKYPGIHIVGMFTSNFAPGPEESAVASLLAAHPNIAGVISQGYVSGSITAFEDAHRKPVAFDGFAYNGPMLDCAKHLTCFLATDPPYQSAYAVRAAVQILEGHKVAHKYYLPSSCFSTNGVSPKGHTCSTIKLGVDAYPGYSAEMVPPVSPPWVRPPLTIKEATGL